MLETLLATIGLPLLIKIVSGALEDIDNPLAQGAAKALGDVEGAIEKGAISDEQMMEANRHVEKLAELESQELRENLSEINQTIRAEVASQDRYVRRMRPTFGYIMALTWAAQMLGIAYIIAFEPARAGEVLNAMSALSAIWGIGLSVLGIYVYKRSEDKKIPGKEIIYWNQ